MPKVTEKMRFARAEAGIEPQDVADKIGRSVSHVRNVESGDKPMRIEHIARALLFINAKRRELDLQPVPLATVIDESKDEPRPKDTRPVDNRPPSKPKPPPEEKQPRPVKSEAA